MLELAVKHLAVESLCSKEAVRAQLYWHWMAITTNHKYCMVDTQCTT